jgi:23S rRNA (guanosine2251-2'-O)-methyltransferase
MAKKTRPALLPHPAKKSGGVMSRTSDASGSWIYGWHAVNAALANPERVVTRIVVSEAGQDRLKLRRELPKPHVVEARELDRMLGADAVHQGIAIHVRPLEPFVLEDIIHTENPRGPIVILDQVSDPQNVGAILRSAAAFDAIAVLYPKDHSAAETPAMAKAACGAIDIVPRIQVTNLATAMRELQAAGWWIIGLEGESKTSLTDVKIGAKTVIVLGAEGKGMRRLTAECCDERVRLPMGERMESLNVSNAAAVALYQLFISRSRRDK